MAETKKEVAALWGRRGAEYRDVARLEGLSLTRVLATMRRSRNDRLARERAEADAVARRVADGETRLRMLDQELREAEARLQVLAEAPATFEAVVAERVEHLQTTGDPRRVRLLELADEKGRVTVELGAIDEASRAATVAYEALVQLHVRLGRVSQWSVLDIVGLTGLWAGFRKKADLDQAALAAYADRCLDNLRTELADLGEPGPTEPTLDIDGFTRFVDFWLDNPFTDWKVNRRVGDARRTVADRLDIVHDLRGRLVAREAERRGRLDAIETERQGLVVSESQ